MAKKNPDRDRVKKVWQTRVNNADKAHKDWAEKFITTTLEDYWEGKQWSERDLKQGAYVINLVHPSIEIKIPSLLYYRPKVTIAPRPARADDQGTDIADRAKLQSDTITTLLADPALRFQETHEFGIRDAMFRFGVVEVGYTSDGFENKRAGQPMLVDGIQAQDAEGNLQYEPKKTITTEQLYLKWISAKQFRVSYPSKNILEENDWCGYYEYRYPADLERADKLDNTQNLMATHKIQGTAVPDPNVDEKEEPIKNSDMVKVWKIWDLRTKKRMIFVDGGDKFLYEEKFKTLPFSELIFLPRLNEWYPLPVCYNWISIQNELNETREMQKIHRKRFYRRYTRLKDSMDPDEWTKLETGGDGVCVETNIPDPVHPIPDAPLDPAIVRNIPLSKEDFREVSGVTGEQRGVVESETATQANILDQRSQIRESYARVKVSKWIAKTCRIMLELVIEKMQLKLWILANVDPLGQNAALEAAKVASNWKEIKASQLGAQVYDVEVDVESLSPLSQDQKRANWERVLVLIIQNPGLAMSDVLLQKTLSYYDITDSKEIQEIKNAMMAILMMAAQQAQAKSAGGGGITGPTNQPMVGSAIHGGVPLQ